MSERINHSSKERTQSPEAHSAAHEKLTNKMEHEAKHAKHEHAQNLEAIRGAIEKEAITAEKSHGETAHEPVHRQHVTRELKNIKYKETMRYVRRHLTPRERTFSKFIHNASVEKVSEVGAKTVARPSGILGGGIVALSGSVIVLYVANKYGFVVQNSLFMVLFIIGFLVGVAAELLIATLTHKKRRRYRKASQI